ncbi:hypothetical protein [Spartinivicinus poritis]|uniref:Uncharacterized protein n=1 Tax=Spartinivicinus poritis TaxID=2994640 RepID=A0ABT5U618_9GAMM|nr:hypothetical protein [Spartinivicinus sp. A2-2]MDE1461007.1 hypothetical protein [Spartinivicinus sp. A2-2]
MVNTNLVGSPTTPSTVNGENLVSNDKGGNVDQVVYATGSNGLEVANRLGTPALDKPVRPADSTLAPEDLEAAVKIAEILRTPGDNEATSGALKVLSAASEKAADIENSGFASNGKLNFTAVLLEIFNAFLELKKSTREDRLDEFSNAIDAILAQAQIMKSGAIAQLALAIGGGIISIGANAAGMQKLTSSFKFMKNSPFANSSNPLVQQSLSANLQSASMRQAAGQGLGQTTSSAGQFSQGFIEEQKAEEQAIQQREQALSEDSNERRKGLSQAILEFIQNFKSNSDNEIQTQKSIYNKMV